MSAEDKLVPLHPVTRFGEILAEGARNPALYVHTDIRWRTREDLAERVTRVDIQRDHLSIALVFGIRSPDVRTNRPWLRVTRDQDAVLVTAWDRDNDHADEDAPVVARLLDNGQWVFGDVDLRDDLGQWQRYAAYCFSCARSGDSEPLTFEAFREEPADAKPGETRGKTGRWIALREADSSEITIIRPDGTRAYHAFDSEEQADSICRLFNELVADTPSHTKSGKEAGQ